MSEPFEMQNFSVVQVNGTIRTDLGDMTGQELYGMIGTRVGLDSANQLETELEQKDFMTVAYKDSFGHDSTYEIRRNPAK